jgi:hypothetical protein
MDCSTKPSTLRTLPLNHFPQGSRAASPAGHKETCHTISGTHEGH